MPCSIHVVNPIPFRATGQMQAAFDVLQHLQASTWRLLAHQLRLPPSVLRDRVVRAAWVSLAYLEWRAFATVTDLPWSLLHDGPSAAAEKLLSMEEPPPEQLSGKAWSLLRQGHSRKDVEAALALLQNVSWTSAFTEKQHASTGFMYAVSALCPWLAQTLQGLAEDHLLSRDALKQIYTVLGATEDNLPVLLRALPHWDEDTQKLNVSEAFMQDPSSISLLSGVLLDLSRMPSFSASRWVSMGCGARLYTLARFTGYHHLYLAMQQQGLMPEYEMTGAQKLGAAEQQWCLEVGLVATVQELQTLFSGQRSLTAELP